MRLIPSVNKQDTPKYTQTVTHSEAEERMSERETDRHAHMFYHWPNKQHTYRSKLSK